MGALVAAEVAAVSEVEVVLTSNYKYWPID